MASTAISEFMRAAKIMDAAFLQFFQEHPNQEFNSSAIATAFGVSRVKGTSGHTNWKWFSAAEDLHSRGLLKRRDVYAKNGSGRVVAKYFSAA